MNKKIQQLMTEQSTWSDRTFNNGSNDILRVSAISYHLQKESKELTGAIESYLNNSSDDNFRALTEELADVGLLLLDVLSHLGLSFESLYSFMVEKHEVNKGRTWGDPDSNGVIEHIRK